MRIKLRVIKYVEKSVQQRVLVIIIMAVQRRSEKGLQELEESCRRKEFS